MIGIKAIAPFFPQTSVKIEDIFNPKYISIEEEDIFYNLGIESIIQDDSYSSVDLAVEASKKVLNDAQINAEELIL